MTRASRTTLFMVIIVGLALGISLSAFADEIPPDKEEIEIDVIEGRTGMVKFAHKKHSTEYALECKDCPAAKLGKRQHKLKKKTPPQACGSCHAKPGEKLIKVKRKEVRALASVKDGKIDKTTVIFHALCIDCHKRPENKDKTNAAGKKIRRCRGCHPKQ